MALFNFRRCMAVQWCIIPVTFLFFTFTFTSNKTSYSAKEDIHRVVKEDYQPTPVPSSEKPAEMTPAIEIRRLLLLRLKAHYLKLPSNPVDIFKIVKKIPNDKSFDAVQHPWTVLGINMTREVKKRVFRSAYETVTNSTYHNMMLTKKNAGDDVDPAIIKELPQKSLLPPPPYKTCAVVGSSGVLTGSRCGAHIDNTDFVFRFNLASVAGFEKDVGSKTNMTTLNPSIRARYGGMKTDEDATNFSHLLTGQNGFVWTPIQKLNATLNPLKRVNGLNPNLAFIRSNTRHFNAHREFWALLGMKKRPSTGFYFVNIALALCSDVHLYGFWPHDKGLDGSPVPYHYYNDVKLASQNHEMPIEFKMLLAMHRLGLVNVHVARCS